MARELAETEAQRWDFAVEKLELVETSQTTQPSGRVDHTFVYRHPVPIAGEAEQRQSIVVSGDRVTELGHFIQIPEAFELRYREMRSANETIASAASLVTVLLLIIGGCGWGLAFLSQSLSILWAPAVRWGVVIATLQALDVWNRWPLLWMRYDTALSKSSYVLQELAFQLSSWIGLSFFLAITFVTAEGLTRLAYPHHPQLWTLASARAAGTSAVLSRLWLGYLCVPLFMAYEVGLYLVAQKRLGWWTPTTPLIEPDVLATFAPWFSPIVSSLQAGFVEECLFRAIPLAGAALIGQQLNRRRLCITLAMGVQALVFAAGHANYATQPSYARLVELLLPALFFGMLYLLFGLLPAIIMHFAYDVIWFSLPLFVSDSPSLGPRLGVLLLTFSPLLFALFQRLRYPASRTFPIDYYNSSWRSPKPKDRPLRSDSATNRPLVVKRPSVRLWLGLGFFALLGSTLLPTPSLESPPLPVNRQQALDAASRYLRLHNLDLGSEWQLFAIVDGTPGIEDEYVWTNAQQQYQELLGTWLRAPLWRIRTARFEGPLEARAEEWRLHLGANGEVLRSQHKLTEENSGSQLSESEAREIATTFLRDHFDLSESSVQEKSVQPQQRPDRIDWTFTYSPVPALEVAEAEPTLVVVIAGDEVADSYRYLDLPEEWLRERRDTRAFNSAVSQVAGLGLGLVVLAALAVLIVSWNRTRRPRKQFLLALLGVFLLNLLSRVNGWTESQFFLSAIEPLRDQLFELLAFGLLGTVLLSSALALLVVSAHGAEGPSDQNRGWSKLTGIGLGGLLWGLTSISNSLLPSGLPPWGDFSPMSSSSAVLGTALGALNEFLVIAALCSLAVATIHRLTQRGTQHNRPILGLVGLLLFAGLLPSTPTESNLWLIVGLVYWFVSVKIYQHLLRHDLSILPVAIGTWFVFASLQEGMSQLYSGALAGHLLGGFLIGCCAWSWSRSLANFPATEESDPIDRTPSAHDIHGGILE